MLRSLQLLLLPAALTATAVLPIDFYPVVDEQYLPAGPVAAPAAPLPVQILPSGYANDQFYNTYDDGGARQGGGRYQTGGHQTGYYDDVADKGTSGREAVNTYDRGLRAQHKKQQDNGYYGDLATQRKAYEDARAFQGGQKYGSRPGTVRLLVTRAATRRATPPPASPILTTRTRRERSLSSTIVPMTRVIASITRDRMNSIMDTEEMLTREDIMTTTTGNFVVETFCLLSIFYKYYLFIITRKNK